MIRSIVVDDQKSFLKLFRDMVKKDFSDRLELCASCTTVKEAIQNIRTYEPDLVFLDIELSNESGFELLEQFPDARFGIIVTTAHEQYAIRAIRFSAVDYLLKPFGPMELKTALDHYEQNRDTKKLIQQLNLLTQNLKTLSDPNKKIAIPATHGYEVVPLKDIIHISSSNNYSVFCLSGGEELVATHPLREYEDLLSEYNFFRVHQSHMINMNHVKTYSRLDGGKIVMSNGHEIEVSRRKKDDFIRRLNQVIR